MIVDRVGIGWRPELAAGILSELDRIDVVELMAEDFSAASKQELRAVQTLAAQVPVVVHGVSLGLASARAVDERRLDAIARVVSTIEPEFWSEHLAFVRASDIEIGHLAAPPRTDATIEGTIKNFERARQIVGALPLAENIATLIDPPGSQYSEADWLDKSIAGTGTRLLLDLNNLYANACNFGYAIDDFLCRIPWDRIGAIHLAGGKWIKTETGDKRLLDDHLHDVPDAVYKLLTEVGMRAQQPLTVILERDGAYPKFEHLLRQLDRARDALAQGRLHANERVISRVSPPASGTPYRATAIESYLALLYSDRNARTRFLANPKMELELAGFSDTESDALQAIDRVGLALAARGFEWKRKQKRLQKRRLPFWRRLFY
jgi:uncharacterized protein (UPF0276 family)